MLLCVEVHTVDVMAFETLVFTVSSSSTTQGLLAAIYDQIVKRIMGMSNAALQYSSGPIKLGVPRLTFFITSSRSDQASLSSIANCPPGCFTTKENASEDIGAIHCSLYATKLSLQSTKLRRINYDC